MPDGTAHWVYWKDDRLFYDWGSQSSWFRFRVTDEGGGKLLIDHGQTRPGIWQHREDKVFICFRLNRGDRPTSFRTGNDQRLLILHRVEPGKRIQPPKAVPGSGSEKVSGEMERGLDLSGEWEGTWKDGQKEVWEVRFGGGKLVATHKNGAIAVRVEQEWMSFDEGRGKMWMKLGGVSDHLGIYKQEGSRLDICYCLASMGRPTSFRSGDGQNLLILHRVKPRK
jgi:hypothetical protein